MNENSMSPETKRHLIQVGIVVAIIIVLGIVLREIEFYKLRKRTEDLSVLTVATIKAQPAPDKEEVILPGSVTGWHDATLFARTSGYLQTWNTDIGTHVKKSQLLAVISAPEVDAELRQAVGDLKTAVANYELAQTTEKRWLILLKTQSVSQQEADEKVSDAQAKLAIVVSTQANVERLRDLVSYQKIIAPFDGVIMSRTTDIGRLINAGSGGTVPLFRIVQMNPLRIYVRVPQSYAQLIQPNADAKLYFSEHPGKVFIAKLLNTANAIDPSTRTLLIQLTMENPDVELLPGGYVQVHLLVRPHKETVHLPVNTLLFRSDGLQVATLDAKSKVVLKHVSILRDFGSYVEIDSGVTPNETIIINPADSLINGQQVRVVRQEKTQEETAV